LSSAGRLGRVHRRGHSAILSRETWRFCKARRLAGKYYTLEKVSIPVFE
jgi:hypothetical protein